MKTTYLYLASFALAGLLLSCSVTRRMEDKPKPGHNPDSLMLVVDQQTDPFSVYVGYQLDVPKRYVPTKAQVIYESYLVNGGSRQMITRIYMNGRTYQKLMWRKQKFDRETPDYSNGKMVVSDGKATKFAVENRVAFEEWMPNAKLEEATYIKKCGASSLVSRNVLANGVLYIPYGPGPVIIEPEPEPEPFEKPQPTFEKAEGYADLSYAVNSYTINPNYGNNAVQLFDMTTLLNKILRDSLLVADHIVITASCSPDGSYAFNETLARNRANSVRDYLIERFKINPDMIRAEYIPEDWDGLRKLVEESTIANKPAILAVIDSTEAPDAREAALRRLPQYPQLRDQMFPKLRRVKYEIFYTEKVLH